MFDQYVEAVCIVFPSGQTTWCEANPAKVSEITDNWVRNNPKYGKGTPCSMAATRITMPKSDFDKISGRAIDPSGIIWTPDALIR